MNVAYEAVDAAGRRSRDTLDAPDIPTALAHLHAQGLYVTSATPQGQKKRSRVEGGKSRAKRRALSDLRASARARRGSNVERMPLSALVVFTRQMAMLMRAGSGVVPALAAIARQTTKPAPRAMIRRLIDQLENGTPLAEAFRRFPQTFDPVYVAAVAAGEASGSLEHAFERLATVVAKRRAMRNKVIGALSYPTLLVTMCCGIFAVLVTFIIPRFSTVFEELGVHPPPSTRVLLATGGLVASYWPIVLGVAVLAAGGLVLFLLSAAGRQWLSDMQTQVPGVGRLRCRLIQAEVFRTIGMLLESGVGVLDTLVLARQSTRNRRFQALFDSLEEDVTSGRRLSTAFEGSGLVEPYVCQAVSTGEDSGKLGDAMTYCADTLDETNAELIGTLLRLLEPVILVAMGLVVGSVAVSLFLPLFDLTSAMR